MTKGIVDKATAEEAAKVLLAWANGEIIEFRSSSTSPWTSADLTGQLSWNFDFFEYRVKPKPIECWVTVLNGRTASTVHATEELANNCVHPELNNGWTVHKVVIE